ncbi:MAG TPA: hypothetical protein VE709_03005 [Pseudonocardiaceae bacterium]|nr:hypothetical protein [Pseudonocardiaceae bacterium]
MIAVLARSVLLTVLAAVVPGVADRDARRHRRCGGRHCSLGVTR